MAQTLLDSDQIFGGGGSNLNEFVITEEIFNNYKNADNYADLASIINNETITQNVINLNNFNYILNGLTVSNKTLIFKNGTVVFGTSGISDSIDKAITASNCKIGFIDCELKINSTIITNSENPVIDLNNTNLTFNNVIADNFIFTTFKTFIQTTNTCNIVLKDTLFNIENRIVSYDPEIDERRPSIKFIKVLTNGSSIEFVNSMVNIRTNNLIGEEGINEGLCQNIIVWVLDLYTAKLQVINSILQIIHGGHGEGGISSRPSRCFDVNLDNLDVVIINSTVYGSVESFSVRNESSYTLKIGKQFTTSDPYMVYLEPSIDIFQGDDEAEDYEPIFENIDCDKYVIVDTINYIEGDYHFTYNGNSWDIERTSFDEDDNTRTTIATDVSDAELESDYGITYELVQGKTLAQDDFFTVELTTHNQPYKILKNFTVEGNTPEYLNQLDYYIEETVIPEDEQEIIDTINYNRQTFANGLAATLERNGLHLRPHTEYDEDTDTETPVMAKIGFWYDEDNEDPNVWKIEIDSEWIEEDEHLMDDVNIVDDFGLEVVLHEGQTIPNLAGFTVIVEPCIEKTKIYIKENINSVFNGGDYGDEEYFPVLEENDQPLEIFSGEEPKGFTQFRDLKTKNIKTETLTTTGNYFLPVDNENLESDNVKDAINELADKESSANSLFDIKTIITPDAENNKGWACTCYDEPHKLNENQVPEAYHEIENHLWYEAESSFALDNKTDVSDINVQNMFYADGYYYFVYGSEGAYQGDIIVGRTRNIDGNGMEEVINLTSELSLSSSHYVGTCNVIQKDDNTFFVFYILNYMTDDYVVIFDKDWNIVMNYHSDESILIYYYITGAVLGRDEYSNKIFIPTIVGDLNDPNNYFTSVRLIIYDIEEGTYNVELKGFDWIYDPNDEIFDFETVSQYTEFYDNKIWMSTNQGAFSIDLDDDYNVHADFISSYYQDISGYGGNQIIGFDGELYYLFSGNISTGSVFLVYKYNGETWDEWYVDERNDTEYTSLMTVQQHKDFLIVDTNTKIYLSRELNDLAELAEITNYGDMILADDMLSVKNTINFNGYSYFDITENRIPFTDTYNINGEEVEITYYKCGNYKICVAGENNKDDGEDENDGKLQDVYEYLGYLPYFWIDTNSLDIVLPRNSNRWTMMYVGNDYVEEEMPEGNYSAFATKDELKNLKVFNLFDIKTMSERIATKGWTCISYDTQNKLDKSDIPTAYEFLKEKLDNVEGSISAMSYFSVWSGGIENLHIYNDYIYFSQGNTIYKSKIEDINDNTKWETITTISDLVVHYANNLIFANSNTTPDMQVINMRTGQLLTTISGVAISRDVAFFTFNNYAYMWSGSPLSMYKIPDIDTSNADDITIENVACSKYITDIYAYKSGYYCVRVTNGAYNYPHFTYKTTDLNDDTKYVQIDSGYNPILFGVANNGIVNVRTDGNKVGFQVSYDWYEDTPSVQPYGNYIDFTNYGHNGSNTTRVYNAIKKVENGYIFNFDVSGFISLYTNDFISYRFLFDYNNIPQYYSVYEIETNGQFLAYTVALGNEVRLYYSQPNLVPTVFTDTYTINGSNVTISYYKSNNYKICTPDIAVGNDTNLQSVYEYLGYLNYWWIDTTNEQITLQRNSNRWIFMYVGDNYEDEELPEGQFQGIATKEELRKVSEISKVNIYSKAVIDKDIISINSSIYDNTRNYFTPKFSIKDIFNANSWEINVKFKYLGRISNYATIATMGVAPLESSVDYQGFSFGIENGATCLFLSSNGSGWNIVSKGSTDTQISLTANTVYDFKLEFTGTQYNLYAKAETDSGYTLLQNVISSTKIGTSNNNSSTIIYGNNGFTGNNYQLYADWYLRYCNIILNNKIVGTLSNDFVREDVLPNQTGNSGKFLATDGSTIRWSEVDALPDQTGQSGKFLTTNGSTTSWAEVQGGGSLATLNFFEGSTGTTLNTNLDLGNSVMTFKNGVLLEQMADYTISGSTLTFLTPLVAADKIGVVNGNVSSVDMTGYTKTINFTNISVLTTDWVIDNTYANYGFKCVISGLLGVTVNSFAQVIFAPTEADSGNYSTVCETGNGTITIYSKVDNAITIPNIVIMGE